MSDLLEKILFLEKVRIFEGLSLEELGEIAQIVDTEEYQEEEILFKMGSPGDYAYILVSGSVDLYTEGKKGEKEEIKRLSSGSCFGEMALLDGQARSATAEVIEDSIIASIGREDFLTLVRKMPAIAISLIEQMSLQLREANIKVQGFKNIGKEIISLSEKTNSILQGD